MKMILLTAAVTSILSVPALASDNLSAFHVGYAHSEQDISSASINGSSKSNGMNLGVDLNRIFSVDITYTTGTQNNIDFSQGRAALNIGYTFGNEEFNIKPYGGVGINRNKLEAPIMGTTVTISDTSFAPSVGLKATFFKYGYASLDYSIGEFDTGYEVPDLDTTTFSIGANFPF